MCECVCVHVPAMDMNMYSYTGINWNVAYMKVSDFMCASVHCIISTI